MSASFAALVFRVTVPVFASLVILREFGLLPTEVFLPFLGLLLVLLSFVAVRAAQPVEGRIENEQGRFPVVPILVAAAFAVAFSLRAITSWSHSVLLGYDPGFYRSLFDTYLAALPGIPEAHLASWLRSGYPQGLPVMVDLLHVLARITPDAFMRALFPAIGAAVVFPLYLLARDLYGRRAAAISALLYAASYTAIYTFGLMYLKNVVGLFLALLAFYAITRRHYAIGGILLGGVGFYHRPTFLLAVLTAIAVALALKDRRMVLSLVIAAAVAGPAMLLRFDANFALLRDIAGSGALASPSVGGTFFDLQTFRWASLGYQPFALIAALHDLRARRWNVGLLLLAVSSGLVVYEVFFFNRFIIPLNVAMLLLAGRGIDLSVNYVEQRRRSIAVAGMSALALVGVITPAWRYSRDYSPMVTPGQLQAVEWIRGHTPADAIVVASAYDAPWAIGWSGREVVAPGLFNDTIYSKDQWVAFLHSEDPVAAAQFVSVYDSPVYIYFSGEPGSVMDVQKFISPEFELAHADGGAEVFRLAAVQPGAGGKS